MIVARSSLLPSTIAAGVSALIDAAVMTAGVPFEAGVDSATAADLVRFGQAIRRLETGGLREVASTRVLIAAGRLIVEGLSMRTAAEAAIAGPLTDDVAVNRSLKEMIEVYLTDPSRPDV